MVRVGLGLVWVVWIVFYGEFWGWGWWVGKSFLGCFFVFWCWGVCVWWCWLWKVVFDIVLVCVWLCFWGCVVWCRLWVVCKFCVVFWCVVKRCWGVVFLLSVVCFVGWCGGSVWGFEVVVWWLLVFLWFFLWMGVWVVYGNGVSIELGVVFFWGEVIILFFVMWSDVER